MNDIDFNNIKYNLYDILNVLPTDNILDIKKKYIKTIKVFHPDKNSELEEDIYYHIILAGKILTNEILKDKYDKIILNKIKTHDELKHLFIKETDVISNCKEFDKTNFDILNNEYNKQHGYNEIEHKNYLDKYNNLKSERKLNKININNSNDIFKQDIKTEIIKIPSEIINYINGENFTYISDINNLYLNDSIETSKFTSLDKAFILYSINNEIDNLSIEEKIKNYNMLTKELTKTNK